MPPVRLAAVSVLALRVAYGAGLIVAPARLAERWLGSGAGRAPVAVPLRGLGMREVVLHGLALRAALRGGPVRPWLAGSVAGDLADIAATVAGRAELPAGAAPAAVAVAGASAAVSIALAVAASG